VIAGDGRDAIDLLPALDANPQVEVTAIVTDDPDATRSRLAPLGPALARQFSARLTRDMDTALAIGGLVAVVDGGASPRMRERLHASRGLQVVTPGLARTLFGFGPVGAVSKPDLLQILREILLSAELTSDQRSVLDLVLQVAVAATGADRGSLLLWDEREGVLRVAASLGIEEELLEKIRVAPGEGIAGRAFASRSALLVHGKADRQHWQILRERDDVESAISAPLLDGERALGVLNLSHARNHQQFDEDDLRFVEELARLDARILARAKEFDRLLRESRQHRLEADLRRTLARNDDLGERLDEACSRIAQGVGADVAELWLCAAEPAALVLRATSARSSGTAERPGPGIVRHAAHARRAVWLAGCGPDAALRCAALPLADEETFLGVLTLYGARDGVDDALEARWSAGAQSLVESLRDALATERTRLASQRSMALAEALAAFPTCRSAQQVHDLLAASALLVLDAEDAVLRLRHDASSRFPVVAWSGAGGWRRPPFAEVERKLAAEAMRTRQTQRATAAALDGPLGAADTGAIAHALIREGWVVGTLCVFGKAAPSRLFTDGFDAADEDALATLARHAHVALSALDREPRLPASAAALPGRRELRERLSIEIERARIRGHRVLLVEIEIAGLDALEDARGEKPAAGDVLREALRAFDLVARVGQDRFAALVPEPDEETSALLARLHRALRESLDVGLEPLPHPAIRMGYAAFPDDGGDVAALEARSATPRVEAS
jgi:GGDEF domain-containing protein